MASYVESALTPGEQVFCVARVSIWSLAGWIALGLLLLPLFGVGIIFWLGAYVQYMTTEVAVTNKRVISKSGFISRHTVELNLVKVESIQVSQSITGRLFDYGSLVISGGGTPQAPVHSISNPLIFRRAFMEAQEKALKQQSNPLPT